MSDEERRAELANFLRARRQSIQPEQAGLPRPKSHRRTPGLRREDVAELTNISVTWYTWLEQGRAIQASTVVLNRLADVLLLDVTQREYLFALAIPQLSHLSGPLMEAVSPRIQRLLDAYGTNPAYVLDSHFDILAWNQITTDVFCDFTKISLPERNDLALLFSDHMRVLILNWESHAQHALATFRVNASRKSNELWYTSLIEELSKRHSDFRARWTQCKIQQIPEMCTELDHPIVGLLVLERTVLMLPENPDLRIIVYIPHPESDSSIRLQQLGTLRVPTEKNVH